MRLVLVLVVAIAGGWFFANQLPGDHLSASTPDGVAVREIPIPPGGGPIYVGPNGVISKQEFEEGRSRNALLMEAEARGMLRQDPQQRALRDNVLRASRRLEQSPCNEEWRRELMHAIGDLSKERRSMQGRKRPVESVTVDGVTIDTTDYLDREVAAIVSEVAMTLAVQKGNAPKELAGTASSRYACN